tara:strand:+ start:482 stop:694 length:213 start_codon:yes stop_codon:yes gene_type:complete
MDISEQSVIHVEKHIEESFSGIMKEYVIKEMYWNDNDSNNIRAIAEMYHPEDNSLNNLYVLFPPLIIDDE